MLLILLIILILVFGFGGYRMGPGPTTGSKTYRFEDPPSNDPSTPRMICRPTVLPIVRAALFTIACTTVSPRREPPEPPSTPPSAVPAASRLPSHPEPE